jgi:hypothetical protein
LACQGHDAGEEEQQHRRRRAAAGHGHGALYLPGLDRSGLQERRDEKAACASGGVNGDEKEAIVVARLLQRLQYKANKTKKATRICDGMEVAWRRLLATYGIRRQRFH